MDTLQGQGYDFSKDFDITNEIKNEFDKNGFIVVRNLLNTQELTKFREALEHDQGINTHAYERNDGEGRKSKTCLWNNPGDDITGMIGRSEKVAGTMEKLLGGEVYHYHSKLIMKEPFTGGAHIWHQDYGYWYVNGCLFPDMGTVWIAVDKADRTNGCLKIIPRSHQLGRIDHVRVGDQAGADLERVAEVQKVLGFVYAELEPGDALFFHCNVLHRSDQNSSPRRRWAFLCCYNRASNNPVYEHHHPLYTPLNKVANSAILACGTETKEEGKVFFGGPKQDYTLNSKHKLQEAK